MVLGYFLCAFAVVTGLRAGDLPVVVVSSSVRLLLGKCSFCVYRVFSVNYLCCGDIQSKSFFFFVGKEASAVALLLPRAPHLFLAMSRINLKDFPQLVIDSNDVFSSWRSWLTEFRLCIEMAEMNMGTERVIIDHEEQIVNVFRGRRKLVALLSSIGKDGR